MAAAGSVHVTAEFVAVCPVCPVCPASRVRTQRVGDTATCPCGGNAETPNTSFSAFDDRASTILSPSDAANSAARQRSSTDHQPGPHSSAMFCDASLRTWGRPGGCGLARTRGCVPNTNPFQMRVQTTVPCAQGGTNSFLGSLHAPASVWGPCAPGSRCCGWSSWS